MNYKKYTCPKCKGKGFIKIREDKKCIHLIVCDKCKGHKNVDWLGYILKNSYSRRKEVDAFQFEDIIYETANKKSKDVDFNAVESGTGIYAIPD